VLALRAITARVSRAVILRVHLAASLRALAVPPHASASIAAAMTAKVDATSCGVAPMSASSHQWLPSGSVLDQAGVDRSRGHGHDLILAGRRGVTAVGPVARLDQMGWSRTILSRDHLTGERSGGLVAGRLADGEVGHDPADSCEAAHPEAERVKR
jgi:hypothetical protein